MHTMIGRIFVLVFLLGTVPSAKGEEVQFEVYYKGEKDYEKVLTIGIDSTITFMKNAAEKDPQNEELQFALATLYWQYDFPQALEQLRKVLRINPEHTNSHFLLGTTYRSNGDYLLAEQHYRRAIKSDPKFVSAYHHLALTFAMEQKEKAIEFMSEVQVLFPSEKSVFFNQGLNYCYLRKPDYAACKDNLLKAKSLDPHHFDTNYALGLVTLKNHDYAEGRKYLQKALQIQPQHPVAVFLLAWSHYKEGDMEKALPLAKQALVFSPNNARFVSFLKKIEEAQKDVIKDSEETGS